MRMEIIELILTYATATGLGFPLVLCCLKDFCSCLLLLSSWMQNNNKSWQLWHFIFTSSLSNLCFSVFSFFCCLIINHIRWVIPMKINSTEFNFLIYQSTVYPSSCLFTSDYFWNYICCFINYFSVFYFYFHQFHLFPCPPITRFH